MTEYFFFADFRLSLVILSLHSQVTYLKYEMRMLLKVNPMLVSLLILVSYTLPSDSHNHPPPSLSFVTFSLSLPAVL